jgi:site-specific DNA recombinase
MKKASTDESRPAVKSVRCAVYTRKSTEEGLEKEFNSLDAQREAGEAYVASQRHEGWHLSPEKYDDGGFTGGNMDRPALTRLMVDIEAGQVDCVVVYKVDRLSRSLLDFARMMEVFETRRVAFVSVTQQFNTATSMGRLVLNVLLSFAQFEREIISERTRDKIAATRKKGKWAGGHPILGFDVDPTSLKLVVNNAEATQVRAIFQLYLEYEALLPVVQELIRRGWTCKRWQTRKGHVRGGQPFIRTSLYRLLTNVAYLGKVRHKDAVYDGEHTAIVDADIFNHVQTTLKRNGSTGGAPVRNRFGALLRGLVRCVPCGCAMSPTHTTRKGNRRYRYYVCSLAQKRGWDTCPSKSIPAAQIEGFVVEQIKCIGRDPALRAEVFAQARRQAEALATELEAERRGLDKALVAAHADVRQICDQLRPSVSTGPTAARMAELHESINRLEARAEEVRNQLRAVRRDAIDEGKASTALAAFDPVWAALAPREQERIIHLLVERVDYNGAKGTVTVAFHSAGIRTLVDELAQQPEGRTA